MFHYLLHVTGGDNGSGPFYLELSGFVSILLACGFVIKWYEGSRCHHGGPGVKGCRKHGRYPFQHYKLCHKHHPAVPDGGILTSDHLESMNYER